MKTRILIVDDEKPTRDVLARILSSTYDCLTAPDAEQALKLVADNPDLALLITDYRMEPGDNGVELMKKAKSLNPHLGCILITAFGEIDLAVEAMKDGADDFLTKPITDLDQLEIRVAKAIKTGALTREVADLKTQLNTELEDFTGKSPTMQRVYRLIRQVAPTDATVMITGPSGSGKELTARAIHNLSRRAQGPFVAIECAALSKDLLESELFGYAPGTFTGQNRDGKAGCFEAAAGGTIFLDEIGEIDLATQVKLLRTLESKTVKRLGASAETPVDFRLVAATNRDLAAMVAAGTFRSDLYYRLNVIPIATPALKDHPEDIAPIVARFIREFSAKYSSAVSGIEPDAMKALERCSWPGNVRQLRNVIERAIVLATGERITAADLPDDIFVAEPTPQPAPQQKKPTTETPSQPKTTASLADTEKQQILATLEQCNGNKSRAADILGISRRTLHRKLKEWKLDL